MRREENYFVDRNKDLDAGDYVKNSVFTVHIYVRAEISQHLIGDDKIKQVAWILPVLVRVLDGKQPKPPI